MCSSFFLFVCFLFAFSCCSSKLDNRRTEEAREPEARGPEERRLLRSANEPNRAEPSQAEPQQHRADASQAKPNPSQAKARAKPAQAKGTRGQGDQGPGDQGTRGPGDRGTRGLGGQGTWGPGTRGCKDNITTEWLSGGAKFPIPDRPGRPRLVHRRRVWKHDSLQRRWDFGGYKDETIMITIVARECSTMTLDIIPLRNDTIRVYPAGSRFHALNLNSQCPRPTCSSERGVNSVYLEISTEATIRKPESDLSPKHDVLSSCRGSELGILRRPTQEWSGGGASSFRLLALLLHLFLLLDSVCN